MNGSVSLARQVIDRANDCSELLPECGLLRQRRLAHGKRDISLHSVRLDREKYVLGLLVWHTTEGNKQYVYEPLDSVVRDYNAAYELRMLCHQVRRVSHC